VIRQRQRPGGDDGFLLIEVVVALLIFAILFSAITAMLISSIQASGSSRTRVVAANLADREVAITRGEFESPAEGPTMIPLGQVTDPDPLPGGTAGQPLQVDGVPFTVTRSASWVSQSATTDPCDGAYTGQLAYLQVRVAVSWPHMDGSPPVVDQTLLTPQVGTYPSGTGAFKVKVYNVNGLAESGAQVTLTGPSGTTTQSTDSYGCAFFPYLAPGNYTASLGPTSGYVDVKSWSTNPSSGSLAVTAGYAQTWSDDWDQAATLSLTAGGPLAGYPLANETSASGTNNSGFSYTLANSGLPTGFVTEPASGTTTTVGNIWPYPNGVTVWAGDCADANPGSSAWNSATTPSALTTSPGQTTSADIPAMPLQVSVVNSSGTPVSGAQVIAAHAVDTNTSGPGCTTSVTDPVSANKDGEYLTLPTATSSTGISQATLPFGTFTFEVELPNGSGGWKAAAACTGGWTAVALAPPNESPTGSVSTTVTAGSGGYGTLTVKECS
jgi:type II secretory pathway pseudopilin PulG